MMKTDSDDTSSVILKQGYLSKKGGDRRNWTYRFFILRSSKDSFVLEYYKDHKDLKKPKGVVPLRNFNVGFSNRKAFCLSLGTENREYFICGQSQQEIEDWREALLECDKRFALLHQQAQQQPPQPYISPQQQQYLQQQPSHFVSQAQYSNPSQYYTATTVAPSFSSPSFPRHSTPALSIQTQPGPGGSPTLTHSPSSPSTKKRGSVENPHHSVLLTTFKPVPPEKSSSFDITKGNGSPTSRPAIPLPALNQSMSLEDDGVVLRQDALMKVISLLQTSVQKLGHVESIVKGLFQASRKPNPIITYDEVKIIACNRVLPDLVQTTLQFIYTLETTLREVEQGIEYNNKNPTTKKNIAHILMAVNWLDPPLGIAYRSYLENLESAVTMLNRIQTRHGVAELLTYQKEGGEKISNVHYNHLLRLGTAHLSHYQLIIHTLADNVSDSDPDCTKVSAVVSTLDELLLFHNDVIGRIATRDRIQFVLDTLGSVTNIDASADRVFLREGEFISESGDPLICFLFNDCIVITKDTSEDSGGSTNEVAMCKYLDSYVLNDVFAETSPNVSGGNETFFGLLLQQRSDLNHKYTLMGSYCEDRDDWLDALQTLIGLQTPSNMPSRPPLLRTLSSRKPLSPPPTTRHSASSSTIRTLKKRSKIIVPPGETPSGPTASGTPEHVRRAHMSIMPTRTPEFPDGANAPTLQQRSSLFGVPPPVRDSHLMLRVYASATRTLVVVRVKPTSTAREVLDDVLQNSMLLHQQPNQQHQLVYVPTNPLSCEVWFNPITPLAFYGLPPSAAIEVRSRTSSDFLQPTYICLIAAELEEWIYVAVPGGPSATIQTAYDSVSSSIRNRTRSPTKYCLFLHTRDGGVYLEDHSRTLADYGVIEASILEIKKRKMIEFDFVSGATDRINFNGRQNTLTVPPTSSLLDTIEYINKRLVPGAQPYERSTAVYHVRGSSKVPLDTTKTLEQCGIRKKDVLELVSEGVEALRVNVIYAHRTDAHIAGLSMLPGEALAFTLPTAHYLSPLGMGTTVAGALYITTFRLVFMPSEPMISVQVPLYTAARIDVRNRTIRSAMGHSYTAKCMEMFCKDMRTECFLFLNQHDAIVEKLSEITQKLMFPEPVTSDIFAFNYRGVYSDITPTGWEVYNAVAEYARLGFPGDGWRLTDINKKYTYCPTYPPILAVPESISDDQLKSVFAFRSRGRIPAVTWRHPRTMAVLARCSQPLVGLKRTRCAEDEALIAAIRKTTPVYNNAMAAVDGTSILWLVDARPKANAYANAAMGAGFEDTSGSGGYANCTIEFLNVANIHVMREAHTKVDTLIQTNWEGDNPKWFSQLEISHWLDHIRMVLQGAARISNILEGGQSVVLHCSDGWDRTAQLTSLVGILIDPFYRTIRGLSVLIEKEWLSFGHKFHQRIGHGNKNHADDQRAPIFVQFIDTVWQLMQQTPCAFEYNEALLITIVDSMYNCKYGTFLCNSDKERREAKLSERTVSLWSHVLSNTASFSNPTYQYDVRPIVPLCDTQHLQLWKGFYMRNFYLHRSVFKDTFLSKETRVAELNSQMMANSAQVVNLTAENASLRAEIASLRAELSHVKATSGGVGGLGASVGVLGPSVGVVGGVSVSSGRESSGKESGNGSNFGSNGNAS